MLFSSDVQEYQDAGQLRAAGDRRRDPRVGVAVRSQAERHEKPSRANEAAFNHGSRSDRRGTTVDRVDHDRASPRNREEEARKRRSGPRAIRLSGAHTEVERLSQHFMRFADEARTYAGPLYEALSSQVARDAELLNVARHVRRPPVPNVFFAAVHFLLAEASTQELSAFYGSLHDNPRPPADAHHAFRDFVLSILYADTLLQTRIPDQRGEPLLVLVAGICSGAPIVPSAAARDD